MNLVLLVLVPILLMPKLQSEAEPESDGFASLRQPVLGLLIQWNAERELYRLVTADEPARTLQVGSLEQCEQALVLELRERYGEGRTNLRWATLGGVQFWSDVFWYAGWRIQEHVYTGHFRLLDPADTRVAWGSFEACRTRFEAERSERDLKLASDHLVVLLHGLGRSRKSMEPLRKALEQAGYSVAAAGYPSTRRSIEDHANGLTEFLSRLDDVRQVSFVTHSLGGIVVRAALADEAAAWRDRIALGRIVMLAPPNRGSELARELSAFSPFSFIAGPSALEVTEDLVALPAPPCPFGIVAASRESDSGFNPLIEGNDDGVVAVEETKLKGAADHLVVRGLHTFIMSDPAVIAAALRFLESGQFREPDADEREQ